MIWIFFLSLESFLLLVVMMSHTMIAIILKLYPKTIQCSGFLSNFEFFVEKIWYINEHEICNFNSTQQGASEKESGDSTKRNCITKKVRV